MKKLLSSTPTLRSIALLVLTLVVAAPAAGASWRLDRDRNNNRRNNSRLSRNEQRELERRMRRELERRRREAAKEREQRRKEIQKMSLELVKEMFKKGQEAEKAENWNSAYHHYFDCTQATSPGTKQMVTDSRKKVEELQRKARTLFRQAEARERIGKSVEAAKMFAEIISVFSYADEVDQARARLRILKRNPRTGAKIAWAEAEVLDEAQDYVAAAKAYQEIVEEFPREVAALKARKRLEEFEEDEAISEILNAARQAEADLKAPKLLQFADNYAMNERYAQARRYLLECIEQFPGTEYAETAQEKLDALPRR
jgi:outer membrane protein assembly factor BamD (BamD/ComL family)